MTNAVTIVEVAPRDGLQNETATVPTEVKAAFVDALSAAGVDEIEVSAFVSPRWIPQLADAEALFAQITRRRGVRYSALVPNEQGLERALAAGVDRIAVFTAASETFNQKNINASTEDSIRRFAPVVRRAQRQGIGVRGYVSTAFWCAFEGPIAPDAVARVAETLVALGIEEVSLSDTVGKASPDEVERLLDRLLPTLPTERIAMHFHDTYRRGVENVLASYFRGIRIFDSSVGGLGGCPYAPGATGNVATEDVLRALAQHGADVSVDPTALRQARGILAPYLKDDRRALPPDGAPACAACEHSDQEVCCRTR